MVQKMDNKANKKYYEKYFHSKKKGLKINFPECKVFYLLKKVVFLNVFRF